MRGVLDVGDFIPKARRRLRLLNTALHLAELVRLLAVFPRMMQSIILQRQFELIHLGFTPTPLSAEAPAGVLLSKAIIYTIPSERKTNTNLI